MFRMRRCEVKKKAYEDFRGILVVLLFCCFGVCFDICLSIGQIFHRFVLDLVLKTQFFTTLDAVLLILCFLSRF